MVLIFGKIVRLGVVLSLFGGLVAGHGDEMGSGSHDEMGMVDMASTNTTKIVPTPYANAHTHGMPILQQHGLTPAQKLYWENYNTTTYFTSELGDRRAFHYHVFTTVVVLIFLYPICLMLNTTGSNWYLPVLTLNTAVTVSSLFALSLFAATFPENMYPGNLYQKTAWILLFLVLIHYAAAVVSKASSSILTIDESESAIPLQQLETTISRSSNFLSDSRDMDLEVTTEIDSDSAVNTNKGSTAANSIDMDVENLRNHQFKASVQKRNMFLRKLFECRAVKLLASRFGFISKIIFNILNYPLLAYFFFNACTGLAVGNLFGKGARIFNLLAHWIKGGVFITLGVTSLARYCGFGKRFGWAWNRVIIKNSQYQDQKLLSFIPLPLGTITMEGLESFLIFFYGSTNVFLEHLAGAGGAWTPKDLQHVSIAFMYIGAGLCGLLTEVKLNKWKYDHVKKHANNDEIDFEEVYAASPGYSPNPFPTFTIFWTGILMSQHAQASATSTAVHIQWGDLLSYGSFFRLLTFLILFLVPNTSSIPAKPFTELITSFCMIAGGLIFMESTDQVIEAMEYRGYTPMFTFNISVGVVSLLMAWEMIIFLCKEHLEKRNQLHRSSL